MLQVTVHELKVHGLLIRACALERLDESAQERDAVITLSDATVRTMLGLEPEMEAVPAPVPPPVRVPPTTPPKAES